MGMFSWLTNDTGESVTNRYTDEGALPVAGRVDIIADWDGNPALIVRTLEVEKVKFRNVTPTMALREGEDSDIEGWRKRMTKKFGTQGKLDRDALLVFETFELVEDLGVR